MAKGSPSEVFMVGDAADTRPRVQETPAPPRREKVKAEIFEPQSGGYAFAGEGGYGDAPAKAPPVKTAPAPPEPTPPPPKPAPPPPAPQPVTTEPPVKPKAKAAPKQKPKPKKISPQEQGKVMVQAVFGSVIERMKAEAAQRGDP